MHCEAPGVYVVFLAFVLSHVLCYVGFLRLLQLLPKSRLAGDSKLFSSVWGCGSYVCPVVNWWPLGTVFMPLAQWILEVTRAALPRRSAYCLKMDGWTDGWMWKGGCVASCCLSAVILLIGLVKQNCINLAGNQFYCLFFSNAAFNWKWVISVN